MGVFEHYQERFDAALEEELSLQDYLELCKSDPSVYATAAERLLMAIGEPEFVDTSKDSRLSRIFSNKIIKRYPAFGEFYGMEEAIEQIVSYFKHAAQGLEAPGRVGQEDLEAAGGSDHQVGAVGGHDLDVVELAHLERGVDRATAATIASRRKSASCWRRSRRARLTSTGSRPRCGRPATSSSKFLWKRNARNTCPIRARARPANACSSTSAGWSGPRTAWTSGYGACPPRRSDPQRG